MINFAINLFPIPKQIVRTHSYIIFLYYTKKWDLIDAQVLFWRPQIQLRFAEIQHVRRFDGTRDWSRARLFDSCQVVVVCYSRCFRLLVLCFCSFGLMNWIRHPTHWKLKALVYWPVTRRAIIGGRGGSEWSAKPEN